MHNTEFCKDDFYIVLIFLRKKSTPKSALSLLSVYFQLFNLTCGKQARFVKQYKH